MCGLVVRFMSKVKKTRSCWIWTAYRNKKGYGIFCLKGPKKAHRVAYELLVGPIPEGLHVLHRCDTPSCVNPKHLFTGDNNDNVKDKMQKGRFVRHSKGGMKGSDHVFAKLTDAQVEEIRSAEGLTQREIAEIYGVDRSRISMIRNDKAYRRLPSVV